MGKDAFGRGSKTKQLAKKRAHKSRLARWWLFRLARNASLFRAFLGWDAESVSKRESQVGRCVLWPSTTPCRLQQKRAKRETPEGKTSLCLAIVGKRKFGWLVFLGGLVVGGEGGSCCWGQVVGKCFMEALWSRVEVGSWLRVIGFRRR